MYNTILFIVVGILLIGVIYFVFFQKKRYQFRVRHVTGTKCLIIDDIGIEFKNPDGVKYIKLRKHKEVIPLPPETAIDLNKNGKPIVECYRDPIGNYQYIKDKGINEFFHPINTNQQIILADQIVKAKMKKKSGLMENLPALISFGFAAVVIVSILLFYKDAISPVTSAANSIMAERTKQLEIERDIGFIRQDVQLIKGALEIPDVKDAPN